MFELAEDRERRMRKDVLDYHTQFLKSQIRENAQKRRH
jgi:hypothetical protein